LERFLFVSLSQVCLGRFEGKKMFASLPHSYAIIVLFDWKAVNASDLEYMIGKKLVLVHKKHKNVKLSDGRERERKE